MRRVTASETEFQAPSAPELQRLESMPSAGTTQLTHSRSMSPATMLHLQAGAGNRAVASLVGSVSVQRFGLGFLGDIASGIDNLLGGGEPTELQQKGGAVCTEKPLAMADSPVPVSILADTALEFSQKIKGALAGNPHMQPKFSWDPETDDNGRISKVNLKVTTTIVRPRYAGGRGDEKEVALIRKLEGLIKAHEERHKAIAVEFAAKAVCAAFGKTAKTYEAAINTVLCQMNKAQEALDHKEGTVGWTLDPTGTRVADVSLAPEPSASYPCT